MPLLKVIFLGSKPIGFHCFQFLLEQQEALAYEVVGLMTRERTEFGEGYSLLSLAAQYEVPVYEHLDDLPVCDIIYSVQYHQILKQRHISKAHKAALNLHIAPLPEYRGSNQFSFALIDQQKIFGTTIHLIDTQIDHGAILFQKRFYIPERCWVEDLYALSVDASLALFKETLPKIIMGKYKARSQKKFEKRLGTSLHYKNEAATIKIIDLNWDLDKMDRHIRATAMPGFEPPYCIINGKKAYFARKA